MISYGHRNKAGTLLALLSSGSTVVAFNIKDDWIINVSVNIFKI